MNILKQNQTQEAQQETICKIHNLEFIAVDLDLSDKSQIQFFCGKCLVEKINNNKMTTIEQSKERIIQIKIQQKEIKTKETQARLNYYKNILDQMMDFKQSIIDSLDKMQKQIQKYICSIQKEKQELQDYDQQSNYFDDLKQLSELYSQEQQKSSKLDEDTTFINEMQRQFELLFNCSEYFSTIDTFKNTKEIINDVMENNIIELIPLQTIKYDSKTPSLSRICNIHKKEIIMINMESQNKKIEDRFVCVDCISENSQVKYSTIENVNKQWKEYNEESDKIIKEYKKESKDKKQDLINQLAQMRKNYNKKLNEISDKVISEQFLSIDKQKQPNQIKKISIQTLDDEQLLKDLKQLIEKEKEKVQLNQTITNYKNKDSIFSKEIEFHLESLKQYDLQDIQQSLDILKGISVEKNLILQLSEIIQQMQKSGQKDENHKNYNNFINEFLEFIDQAKKYQLQLNLFDQSISNYQSHTQKIQQILQNIEVKSNDDKINKSEQQPKSKQQNLLNILKEYQNIFDNNNQQLQKYCNIQQMENDLIKLTETIRNLEIDKTNEINLLQKSFDQQLIQLNDKLELKQKEYKNVKEQYDQATQENINLKNQYEQDKKLLIKKSEEEQKKIKQDFNQKLNQKDSQIQEALRKLDQINKDTLEQEKIKKMELEKIQQYNKSLTFSNTYKHNNCSVSEGGKLVAEVGNNHWCFCVCEQAIPKTGKIQYAFQILCEQELFVGIGFRDIMKQKNFYDCCNVGDGTYLIKENGYIYSHHNKDIHGKELSFKFKNNDIIIIEVSIEDKYIKWTRQNNPQLSFVYLGIDTSQELYPCVGLYRQAKIKILDCSLV
ncbi:unnamed protein product [Paramecium pentaurelia]|uniref:B30.2/SPRY domain-containing protein n=1 Tax=Paramecium pentaurelia TaxID=43138 RepID=A0A8S1XJN8_9CILI|nr:unnamed protein product [Paramecium pentaurelia]